MRVGFKKMFGCYMDEGNNLNLGCGGDYDPDFVNLDRAGKADIIWDLEHTPLPFQDGRFKFIVASHVIEHVNNYIPLMNDLYRILDHNGHLLIYVPYYTSSIAISDPTHVRSFSEVSWDYLRKSHYETPGAGNYVSPLTCNFLVEATILVPHDEFKNDPEIEYRRRHQWNIISEMCTCLRKE